MQVEWSVFKNAYNSGNLILKEIVVGQNYWLKAIDSYFSFQCLIPTNPEHTDTADYIANYQSKANQPIKSKVLSEPANVSLTRYIASNVIEVAAESSANIDIKLEQVDNELQQILYGGALHAQNPDFSDHVKFQVIDIDNVLGYGANLVLKEYIEKAYLNQQGTFEDYDDAGAYLPVGLYLRCIYTNTKTSGSTKVKINYLLGLLS